MLYFETLPLEVPSQHYLLPPQVLTDVDFKNQAKGGTAKLVKKTHSGKEPERALHCPPGKFVQ